MIGHLETSEASSALPACLSPAWGWRVGSLWEERGPRLVLLHAWLMAGGCAHGDLQKESGNAHHVIPMCLHPT